MENVFISHTDDMSKFPRPRSFVQAAIDAVLKAGNRPVDMAYFSAREGAPAAYCERQVQACNVYLAIVGFRYGSPVPDLDDGTSYVDLEFKAARLAKIPRLVFLLDDNVAVPPRLIDVNRRNIDAFRDRLRSANVIVATFETADGLEAAVLHALSQLRDDQTAFTFESKLKIQRPWIAPASLGRIVERPELTEALLGYLTDQTQPRNNTIGLQGAGGFGKTTLALSVCRQPELKARFPGGLLWVTIGEKRFGAELAETVSGLCEVLSGEQTISSDPLVSGARLGELLDAREPMLLVIDDVWMSSQLAPFLIGGATCCRLVTTRNRGVMPSEAVSVMVDVMTAGQAAATVTAEVNGVSPAEVKSLVRLTGRWPVLLGLVGRAIAEYVEDGANPDDAAASLIDRLETVGPTALDLDDVSSRHHAVAATVEASLDLLSEEEQKRYLELAIFAEDVRLPLDVLRLLWNSTGRLGRVEVDRLRDKIVRLRLASGRWDGGQPAVWLHDVIRAYLRHRAGARLCIATNIALIEAAHRLLVQPHDEDCTPWWTLPATATYLWRYLPFHLAEAKLSEEVIKTVCDLRWVAAKTAFFGSSVLAEADLELAGTPTSRLLKSALRRAAPLLTQIDPPTALGATLASRLSGVSGLEEIVEHYTARLPCPWLENQWELPDQMHESLHAREGHVGGVWTCEFSPDGQRMVSASDDGTVRLWELSTRKSSVILEGQTGGVHSCRFSPGGKLLALACDKELRLWHIETQKSQSVLGGHTNSVYDCAFSPDGKLLASASADGTVRIWDASTTKLMGILDHARSVYDCAFSPDGRLLVSAAADGMVRIWDVSTTRAFVVLKGHIGGVRSCVFSPDGHLIASSGGDGTVRLWDVDAGREKQALRRHTGGVNDCAFSSDGHLLASASDDGTVLIWDVYTGISTATLRGHNGWVRCCIFSPDGQTLATTSVDATVRLWDVHTGASTAVLKGYASGERNCNFSFDGQLFASTSEDGTVGVWEVATHRLIANLEGHTGGVWGCSFSPDGQQLASTGTDGTVRIWEAASGKLNSILEGHSAGVYDCTFSPDGQLLASASADGTVRIWTITTAESIAVLEGHPGGVWGCTFSPDSQHLVSTSEDGIVRIWAVATGKLMTVLKGHTDWVWGCAFSSDGRLVSSASGDGTVRIWDVARSRSIAVLVGHTDWVWDCAFSPDGRLLVSVGNDWTVRVWEVATGQGLAAVRVAHPLYGCAWHPHTPTIGAVGSGGAYLFTYRIDGETL